MTEAQEIQEITEQFHELAQTIMEHVAHIVGNLDLPDKRRLMGSATKLKDIASQVMEERRGQRADPSELDQGTELPQSREYEYLINIFFTKYKAFIQTISKEIDAIQNMYRIERQDGHLVVSMSEEVKTLLSEAKDLKMLVANLKNKFMRLQGKRGEVTKPKLKPFLSKEREVATDMLNHLSKLTKILEDLKNIERSVLHLANLPLLYQQEQNRIGELIDLLGQLIRIMELQMGSAPDEEKQMIQRAFAEFNHIKIALLGIKNEEDAQEIQSLQKLRDEHKNILNQLPTIIIELKSGVTALTHIVNADVSEDNIDTIKNLLSSSVTGLERIEKVLEMMESSEESITSYFQDIIQIYEMVIEEIKTKRKHVVHLFAAQPEMQQAP